MGHGIERRSFWPVPLNDDAAWEGLAGRLDCDIVLETVKDSVGTRACAGATGQKKRAESEAAETNAASARLIAGCGVAMTCCTLRLLIWLCDTDLHCFIIGMICRSVGCDIYPLNNKHGSQRM